jgi:hypothetical protein
MSSRLGLVYVTEPIASVLTTAWNIAQFVKLVGGRIALKSNDQFIFGFFAVLGIEPIVL